MHVHGNLYAILGVESACSFSALKKAYYRRAKECHPDRFGGDPLKEEEFKQLVRAFDILSDPPRRQDYDRAWRIHSAPPPVGEFSFASSGPPIMDSLADDILEELIVGNSIPGDTTLQRLMLDLTSTERFVAFREAKNLFCQGRHRAATTLLKNLLRWSPDNILYHYYAGENAFRLGHHRQACKHLRICLRIGLRRFPPQCLFHIRNRLEQLYRRQGGLGRLMALFIPPVPQRLVCEVERSRKQMERAITRMLEEELTVESESEKKQLQHENGRHLHGTSSES